MSMERHLHAGASLLAGLVPTEVVIQVQTTHEAICQALAVHVDDGQHTVFLVRIPLQTMCLD